jgi:8-oxo-dGTP pyrophosphatase MutT (NUDIX family)
MRAWGNRTLRRRAATRRVSSTARAFPSTVQAGVSVVLARRRPGDAREEYALIQRGKPPNALAWAFPGGRVELGNTMLETAQLELEEDTGIARDRVLWHRSPIGSHDVIVREETDDDSNKGNVVSRAGGKSARIEYHYAVAQVYGELLGCNDSDGDDNTLVAGDDALDAYWWCPADNLHHHQNKSIEISANTKTTRARVEALRSADLLRCVAATLPLPPMEGASSSSSPVSLVEIKQKVDGSAQEFSLECWEWDASRHGDEIVVGRWCAPPGGQFGMPEGSYSWGVWGRGVFGDVAVGAYRMHDPDGRLRGYRFDAISGVEMLERRKVDKKKKKKKEEEEEEEDAENLHRTLVFHDLLLDAVVRPGPEYAVRVEDEDEVEEWTQLGKLSAAQLRTIDEVRQVFVSESKQHGGVARLAGKVDAAIARTVGRVRAGEAVL